MHCGHKDLTFNSPPAIFPGKYVMRNNHFKFYSSSQIRKHVPGENMFRTVPKCFGVCLSSYSFSFVTVIVWAGQFLFIFPLFNSAVCCSGGSCSGNRVRESRPDPGCRDRTMIWHVASSLLEAYSTPFYLMLIHSVYTELLGLWWLFAHLVIWS